MCDICRRSAGRAAEDDVVEDVDIAARVDDLLGCGAVTVGIQMPRRHALIDNRLGSGVWQQDEACAGPGERASVALIYYVSQGRATASTRVVFDKLWRREKRLAIVGNDCL